MKLIEVIILKFLLYCLYPKRNIENSIIDFDLKIQKIKIKFLKNFIFIFICTCFKTIFKIFFAILCMEFIQNISYKLFCCFEKKQKQLQKIIKFFQIKLEFII